MRRALTLTTLLAMAGCSDYSGESEEIQAYCKSTGEEICSFAAANAVTKQLLDRYGFGLMARPELAPCRKLEAVEGLTCIKEALDDDSDLGILPLLKESMTYIMSNGTTSTSGSQSQPALPPPASPSLPQQPKAASASSEQGKGQELETIQGLTFSYRIAKVEPQDVPQVFELMSRKPTGTSEHPLNESEAFKGARIVQEPGGSVLYPVTKLMINGEAVLKASAEEEGYQLESLSSIRGENELLIANVFAGGNSCDNSMQVLVAKGSAGYSVSQPFGRCAPSWWYDESRQTTFIVYAANEYNPMTVIMITRMAH